MTAWPNTGRTPCDLRSLGADTLRLATEYRRLLLRLLACMALTLRFTARVAGWTVRFLIPLPLRVGQESRYRRQSTGLAIPSLDVLATVFGVLALASYFW